MRFLVSILRGIALAAFLTSQGFFFYGADSVQRPRTMPLMNAGMVFLAVSVAFWGLSFLVKWKQSDV